MRIWLQVRGGCSVLSYHHLERGQLIVKYQVLCVHVCELFHSLLEDKHDLHHLLTMIHFCHYTPGLN